MPRISSAEQARLLARAKEAPTLPGVYVMKDSAGRVLYVGKAKSLRNRVRSYFQKQDNLHGRTRLLVTKVNEIEFNVTQNELEALLLECNLIKKHRPRFNVRLKDDKNYPYVLLDFTQPFPQFRIARKVVVAPHLRYFGPFSAGVQEISRFLLKTFKIRDCSDSKFRNRTRPCLNYEIGICTAPCVQYVSQEDYAKQVQEAVYFLEGKKNILLKNAKREMETASDNQEYEKARMARDKIQALRRMSEKQNAVLNDTLQDIDVVGCYEFEGTIQWLVLFLRAGYLTGRRAQRASLDFETMDDATRTFLEQFYTVSMIPDEIWIADDFPDRLGMEEFLEHQAKKKVKIRVGRGEKLIRLLGMARENAKLLYNEGSRKEAESATRELQKALGMADLPHSIEGIDISNIQGTHPVASLVHFADERPLKSRYRLFYPRTVEGQDDFAMIYETVKRRYGKLENPPPDLLLIDGGKGQLASAVKALEELKLELPVCSLAKSRTERSFTSKRVDKSEERIFIPNRKNPIVLREGNPALRLLQRVRDESHRFAITNHRKRRKKGALVESVLTEVAGIGEKTRSKLLQHFGGLEGIRESSIPQLVALGLSEKVADALLLKLAADAKKPKTPAENAPADDTPKNLIEE